MLAVIALGAAAILALWWHSTARISGTGGLLTAAGRLAEMAEPNASARLRPLLRDVRQAVSETAVQAGDPAGYVERLDALCRTVAEYLVHSLSLDTSP